MESNSEINKSWTFKSIWILYFMLFFCIGILPVNIDNLVVDLPGTTEFGIGMIIVIQLSVGTFSLLFFGYFGEKISKTISRKRLFTYTNLIWVLSYGLNVVAPNYQYYLFFMILASIGSGAFLPLGFSIIGDLFPPKERGNKYGIMALGLNLGSGMGLLFGGLLGGYTGPEGWRWAYFLGPSISFLALILYGLKGTDPERGRSEPEFENFEGIINYNYKITYKSVLHIFQKKTVRGILLFIITNGLATATLGNWSIFYLTQKIIAEDSGLIATTLYLLAGIGILPGSIVGGKLGDKYVKAEKRNGRIYVTLIGLMIGISLLMMFYLLPIPSNNPLEITISWILFLILGMLGNFFASLYSGNVYAIYSEVCVPETRSTVNAFNGVISNIGAIIGNLILSSLIQEDLAFLPSAIFLVLFIWMLGSLFWIITLKNYSREVKECSELKLVRRSELEENL
ncbi:MAG: MFS transporter [Candidatus Lokiarchaeota archaeon]|nr:MFS transporter [Candidatus Lokiarchaeota archaeon]